MSVKVSLTNFGKLLEHGVVNTTSESNYELLEPWIQWAICSDREDV